MEDFKKIPLVNPSLRLPNQTNVVIQFYHFNLWYYQFYFYVSKHMQERTRRPVSTLKKATSVCSLGTSLATRAAFTCNQGTTYCARYATDYKITSLRCCLVLFALPVIINTPDGRLYSEESTKWKI